jgi:hypothetical protein
MLVLFAVLNHLLVALQNPSLFGQNGLILHPNRTQKRTATPPCGGMWSPSRSLPILPLPSFFFLLFSFLLAVLHPSSLIPHPFFHVGVWGVFSVKRQSARLKTGANTPQCTQKQPSQAPKQPAHRHYPSLPYFVLRTSYFLLACRPSSSLP